MPDCLKCTCTPRPLRDVQTLCYRIQLEMQMLAERIEQARNEIELPDNAEEIWNGEAAPTLAIEVEGTLGVIADDLMPEIVTLLHRAGTATVRSVAEEWNRLQAKDKRNRATVASGDEIAQPARIRAWPAGSCSGRVGTWDEMRKSS